MIEQADDRLTTWVSDRLPEATVTLEPPKDSQPGEGVSIHLLELVKSPPPRGNTAPPLQISVRYLVTTWAADVAQAHQLLGQLVFTALEDPDVEVEFSSLPEWYWNALGVAPRPFFVVSIPLRKERPSQRVELVREPLIVEAAHLRSLQGQVLGPGDIPIADAFVELCEPQTEPGPRLTALASTRTDRTGRFRFPAAATDPAPKHLLIRARGQEVRKTVDSPAAEPVVVRLEFPEG